MTGSPSTAIGSNAAATMATAFQMTVIVALWSRSLVPHLQLPRGVVGGYPRFQYGGFWFSFVDPWPEYWSDDWYDNDDVYVDYSEDGYYLYNRSYPGDRIAVEVYLN